MDCRSTLPELDDEYASVTSLSLHMAVSSAETRTHGTQLQRLFGPCHIHVTHWLLPQTSRFVLSSHQENLEPDQDVACQARDVPGFSNFG